MLDVTLLWLAQAAIEITGGDGCPDPATVRGNLTSLLASDSERAGSQSGERGPASPSARLSRTPTGNLEILLVAPDGRRLDAKRLEAASACDDLAVAVAVVIATWVSEPTLSLPERLDLPWPAAPPAPREDPAAPAGGSVSARSTSLSLGTPLPPWSTGTLRLGAVASSAAGQWAAGLRVGGGVVLWGDRLGLAAVAAATMPRSESVGAAPGAARWTRGYLGIGPEVTILPGPVTLKAHLQGLLGLLHVTGNGLEMATSETGFRVGTTAGLWASWHGWSGVWPWIGADLAFWPGRERLRVEGVGTEGTVPGLEGQFAAGLGIGVFP